MKRLLSVFALLALLCLAGCFEGTTEGTKAATTPKTEAAHVHQFTERVQDDAYLAEQPVCGQQRIYYYSCACGECSTLVFAGDVEPHAYSVTVTDAGLIEQAKCTNPGCGHVEQVNVKLPTLGTFRGAFSCSDSAYKDVDSAKIFWYDKCESADFDSYCRFLQSAGCRQTATYTMGSNRYALYKRDTFTVYLSYLSTEKAIRIYVGRSDDLIPDKIYLGEKTALVQPALWQIDVDCKAAEDNGGMSYVLQLSDGKFIVIDGGYDTKEDAASIYKILSENKPAEHEKPIIAGWFLTHLHIDHVGALRSFATNYRDKVEVEGFYYNFPYVNISDIWPSNNKAWEERMASFEGATLYRKLHSGMQIGFAGAERRLGVGTKKVVRTARSGRPRRSGLHGRIVRCARPDPVDPAEGGGDPLVCSG